MDISFELVARDEEAVFTQLTYIQENLPFVNIINVPDLLRFSLRSWEVARLLPRDRYRFIPHFRAIDFDLRGTRIIDIIDEFKLEEVLLVSGDPPPNMSFPVFDTKVTDMIERVRKDRPAVKIYAGFDPYRSSVRDEVAYMRAKLESGCDALFSQPFFDMRFLEIYGDLINNNKVYWGISPVVTEKSKNYWETMNNVVFPASFQPDYQWNTDFCKQVLEYSQHNGGNVYFMPIRIDLDRYFSGVEDIIGANRAL